MADVTFLIQRELMSRRNPCSVELRAGLEMAHQQEQWEIFTISSPTRSFAPPGLSFHASLKSWVFSEDATSLVSED